MSCPSSVMECLALPTEYALCPCLHVAPAIPANVTLQDSVSLPPSPPSPSPTLWLEHLLGALPKFLPSPWDPGHLQCSLLGNSLWLTTATSGDGVGFPSPPEFGVPSSQSPPISATIFQGCFYVSPGS